MSKIKFLDTTLRDGEQAPGVIFSPEQKIQIARMLDECGADIIEAGIPAMGDEEITALKKINTLNLNAELLTWNRMKTCDIDASIKTGIKNAHIAIPASGIHIEKKFNKTPDWVISEIKDVASYAHKAGLFVSIGLEDASRADMNFINRVIAELKPLGITRFRYSDTLGIETPFNVFERISTIIKKHNVQIDFHAHNDFGMATANAFSAYKAGAEIISVSVNGLGERAGNTPFEEIALAIKYLNTTDININFPVLKSLSKKVEEYSGIKTGKLKPVFGDNVFTHESGIHVDGLIKSPDVYSFFPPDEIGAETKITIGKHTGTRSIIYLLSQRGITVTEEQATKIRSALLLELKTSKDVGIDNLVEIYHGL